MVAVITRVGREFRYFCVTASYAAWIGRPIDEIAGQSIPDVIGSQAYETIRPHIEQVLAGGKVEYTAELSVHGRGFRTIQAVHVPLHSGSAEVDGWIVTMVDITDRRPMEQEHVLAGTNEQPLATAGMFWRREAGTRQAGRALSTGEAATWIAHEVNQPLAGVAANAEASLRWLSGETPDIQKARESLALIVRDGNRATAVIRSIREFLKDDRGNMETLDMNEIIQEAVAPVRVEFLRRRISLRVDRAGTLPTVWGHRIQLQQVILNLILNGAEAMASTGGPKVLLVRSRRSDDDRVLISVRDSGIGVHPDDVKRIFEPLFSTKDAGMGLGLSISRTIIEAHGGRIWARLNEGPGLTVEFSVPSVRTFEQRAFTSQDADRESDIGNLLNDGETSARSTDAGMPGYPPGNRSR
jgi:signal transduction histidine kinase